MNIAKVNFDSKIVIFGLPFLIILFCITLSLTTLLKTYPELAIGVTYDLTLSAPLLYLFLIRKTKISKLTVIPVFTVCMLIATLILPAENRFHLDLVKNWILPVVEISAMAFLGIAAYKSYKTYKSLSGKSSDVLEILRETCRRQIFSQRVAEILAFEMAVIYYAFLSWKPVRRENTFTYHKKSGITALYLIIIFIIAVETLVMHILLARWSAIFAWILTIFSIYFLFQIFAHLKAVFQRPIELRENKIFLRYGIFGDAVIDRENIESVENTSMPFENEKGVKKLGLLGNLEPHNLKIVLKNEEVLNGFYGLKTKIQTLYLFVDEVEEFKTAIGRQNSLKI